MMVPPVACASVLAAGRADAASIVPSSGTKSLVNMGSCLPECAYRVSGRKRVGHASPRGPTSIRSNDDLPLHVLSVECTDVRVFTCLVERDRYALARSDDVVGAILHLD